MINTIKYSVVILTFNRKNYLRKQVDDISKIPDCEIIIVDNCSEENYVADLKIDYPNIKTIILEKNYGAVGRNYGISAAQGDIIITLDDDIYDLQQEELSTLNDIFKSDPLIKSICFKVKDEQSREICNWCHPKDPEKHSETSFETYNISEGAVAFKRSIFNEVAAYPLDFFISHEGPDLAYRIINAGYKNIYTPHVEVIHAYAPEGRKSWRRYYYDTRNIIWLAYRNYNVQMIIKKLPLQLGAMLIFSIRDGFLWYYFKGVLHGVKGLGNTSGKRVPLTKTAYKRIKQIDQEKPSLLYYVKKRLFRKGVKI